LEHQSRRRNTENVRYRQGRKAGVCSIRLSFTLFRVRGVFNVCE
jgi:hypothetical protein